MSTSCHLLSLSSSLMRKDIEREKRKEKKNYFSAVIVRLFTGKSKVDAA